MNVRKPFDPSPDILVHGVEVNREQTAFVVACEDGFRVYDTAECHLKCYREFNGSLQFGTILSKTNVLVLLGSSQAAPKECPKGDIVLWDNARNGLVAAINDGASRPIRVLINKNYFVPICELGIGIFRLKSKKEDFNPDILRGSYTTVSNQHAVGAMGNQYLAIPGISKGKLALVDLRTMKSSIINAHGGSLRAIALSSDEELIATTSEKGTIVRIFATKDQSRITEFRRGLDEAAIFSIAFSPDSSLLALTSDKGTLHIFDLQPNEVVEGRVSGEFNCRSTDYSVTTPKSSTSPHRPGFPANKRVSYETQRSTKPSSYPPAQDAMTESMILPSADMADPDPGVQNWQHIAQAGTAQKKTARFQDQPPQSIISAEQYGYHYSEYAPSAHTVASTASSSNSQANKAKKYGSLANLAWMPKVLRDDYSVCKTDFTLPGRAIDPTTLDESTLLGPPPSIPPPTVASSASSAVHRRLPSAPQGKNLTHGIKRLASIAQGAPPKGQIAWINETELIVVSAGRGGRWEKFLVQRGGPDGRPWRVACVGWKAYLDEEGR